MRVILSISETREQRHQPAFSLIELLVVIAIIALLISILLPALAAARKTARLVLCESNQSQLAVATSTYGLDFKEQLVSYSWRVGDAFSSDSSLNYAVKDTDAASNQMVDIVRRRGDRTVAETTTPPSGKFFPYARYSHLVLQDYLSQRLPDPVVACPEDADQQRWGKDPRGYDAGRYQPNYGTGGVNWRWPYRSDYMITIAAFDKNPPIYRCYPSDYNVINVYSVPNVHYGDRKLTEVALPSSKVFMYEQFGRHAGKQFDYRTFFGLDTAKCVVQFFDGSVSLRACKDANKGNAYPSISNSTLDSVPYNASGSTPDPPAPNGSISSYVRFQFTRGGLSGVDFEGREPATTKY